MTLSNIIQTLCDAVDDKKVVESRKYQKQLDELIKWNAILDKYTVGDKKFREIFYRYDKAYGSLQEILKDLYYREGFICGASLALEICGFKREEN